MPAAVPVVDGAGGQEVSADLTAVGLTIADGGAASCFQTMQVDDILLLLAVGHSLPRTASPFAALPREVLQYHLAPAVRQLFVQDLAERGLLTPVQAPSAPPPRPPPLSGRRRAAKSRTMGWDVSQRPLPARISPWASTSSPSSKSGAKEQGLLTAMQASTLWKFDEHVVTCWKFEEHVVTRVKLSPPPREQAGTAASSNFDELDCN